MSDQTKPNLFVIGAMKAATTSLHAYLNSHPEIYMSAPKEPGFFVEREQLKVVHPVMESKGFWRGPEYYLELFKGGESAKYRGESSTSYTKLPLVTGVAERLAAFDPNARLIYIMRDPVERTISHFWHESRWLNETRDIDEAVRNTAFYRDVSNYEMQLRPFFDLFPKEQIMALTYESLKNQPEETLRKIFAWLGIDSSFSPLGLGEQHNVTPGGIYKVRGMGLLHRFRYSGLWNAVGPHVPPSARRLARRISERKVDRASVPKQEIIEYLRPIHLQETARLEKLLGRDFPEWVTLNGK